LKTLKHNQHGQAIVEFALVIPLLLLVIFAIIEFSHIFETMNVLTSAAREGARVASLSNPVSTSTVTTAAQTVLTSGSVTQTPTVTVTGPNANAEVTVTVRITYTPITGYAIPGIGVMNLQRSATMHWEG
jgi:Flp pilus assembly protein TadG